MSRKRSNWGPRTPAAINATFITQQDVPADGWLMLWGPDRPEHFPWHTALQKLGVPVDQRLRLEVQSARLLLPREGRLREVNVSGVVLSAAAAVRLLGPAHLEEVADAATQQRSHRRYRPTASLAAWSLAAKLALELLARQSFVPALRAAGDGRMWAVWLAALEASADLGRVRRLATDMPPAAHALILPTNRRHWDRRRGRRRRTIVRVWHPESLVRAFLDAAIDDLVRSNLSALNGSLQSRMGLLSNLPLPPSPSDDAKPLAVRVEERTNFALLRARSQDGAEHAEGSDANASSRQDGASGLHESDRMESPQRSTRASQARRQPESEARRGDESSADELDTRARRGPIILSEKRLSELGRWEFRWVNGLLSPRRQASVDLHPDDPDLLKSFDDWLAWVMGQSMGPAKAVDCKTGFWLEMPEESAGDESFWYLRYVLLAADDASLSVTAAQVFVTGSSRLRVLDHSFDRPQEKLLADLGRAGRIFEPIRQSLESPRPEGVFLDSKQAWRFISEAGPVLYASGFDVRLPEELTGQGQRRLRARLRIRDMDGPESHFKINDLAAFHWEAALGDEAISAEEFRQLAELKQPLVRWRGKWVLVDPLQMRSIQDLLGNANACGTMSRFEALSRALTGLADPNAPNSNIEVVVEGRIAELAAQLANADVGEESAIAVPSAFQGELRAYQERGLSWLAYQSRLGLGCCLADDMGLGKTIQLIAELLHHAEILPDDRRGTLLVCPTSVVGNWQRELQRFAPELPVIRHHGNERASSIEELEARMAKPHTVVITTYGLATRDVELLKQRPWARFVLDEAQAIKNVTAKRSQAVREIDAAFRVALTGTPIENRLSELWAILDFLNPSLLGHFEKFRRSYALPIERYHDAVALERLRRLVGPFIMRRVKTDPGVIKDLPEKMEMKVYCTLTREQATLYQALVDAAMNNIDDAQGIARHGRILALLTRLKQVVDHPHLVQNDKAFEPRRSGKLTRLLEMLEELSDMGERALIFTQFKQMGDILVSVLQERFDVDVPFLHGGVPQQQRDELVERFQDDDGPPFFVLSLRAGGTGLNLTAATHVFHYDRWWNPAVEDQATDRAFRIGQTKNVQVHKMLSIGTLEEKIDSMLTEKRNLADTIVDSTGAWVTELDTDAIRDLVSLSSDATIDDVD